MQVFNAAVSVQHLFYCVVCKVSQLVLLFHKLISVLIVLSHQLYHFLGLIEQTVRFEPDVLWYDHSLHGHETV